MTTAHRGLRQAFPQGGRYRPDRMRRAVLLTAAGVLLAGPTALAFFAGGYFDRPRLLAAVVVWVLVLVAAVAAPHPLPVSPAGRAALAGLVILCVWTTASIAWAPMAEPATDAATRLLLYLGAFAAAIALLREATARRWIEPAFAFGAVLVTLYGLSERVLPGVFDLEESWTAGTRLHQPLTYWNAQGALAAMGLVLCARLAGSSARAPAMRMPAAAGCAPLGAALYLSYSRGAIAAGVLGLVVLLAAAPSRRQLRAVAGAVLTGSAAALAAAALPGVATLDGSRAQRIEEGAVMVAILLLLAALAALGTAWVARREGDGRLAADGLPFASRLPGVAVAAVVLTAAGLIVGGLGERGDRSRVTAELNERRGAARLTSVDSRRYDYWRIGVAAISDEPVRGLGAGAFRVVWLRERPVEEGALEVHSLPLEAALELGFVGLLGLGLLVGGAGTAARVGLRRSRSEVAGPVAACTVFLAHASIDWDWQLPAVTLPALVMSGALVAVREDRRTAGPAPAATERRRRTVPAPPPRPAVERQPVGSGV